MPTIQRRLLVVLAHASLAWAVVLLQSHGVRLLIGPIRITSRQPANPAIVGALMLAGALLLAPRGARWRTLASDERWLVTPLIAAFRALQQLGRIVAAGIARPRVASALAAALALAMPGMFALRGVFVAGGADAYGYVSEARLFTTGQLRLTLPWVDRFPHIDATAFTPLGYLFDAGHRTFTPVYSPGVPLVMSLFERAAGPDAVYLVMPLLAALAVWSAFLIGRRVSGPATGVGAALLVATSPAIVFQLVFPPMSDIAAMGWWSLALALVLGDGRWRAAAAGLATSLAIVTRPNLVLLAAVIGGYLLWQAARATSARRQAIVRVALYAVATLPGCLAVAWFYNAWYGSPLRSGYGGDIWGLSFWWPNLVNYATWLTQSQTPLLLAGYLTPFVARRLAAGTAVPTRAVFLALFALTVFLSYVFYIPFDAWWYLRFLLSAYPALAVLTCTALALCAARYGTPAKVVAAALVIAAATYGMYFSRDASGAGDYRYRLVAEYVRDRLPAPAVVVCFQHSGSMLFYSDRPILRYDLIQDLDAALTDLHAAGYHTYLVVDGGEVDRFKTQFAGRSRQAALDWQPRATLELADVRVWELTDEGQPVRGDMPDVIAVPGYVRRRLP